MGHPGVTDSPPLSLPYSSAPPWPSWRCYCGMLHPFGVFHPDVQLAERGDPLWADALWKRHHTALLASDIGELRMRGQAVPDDLAALLAAAEACADEALRIAELRDEMEGAHDADPDRQG